MLDTFFHCRIKSSRTKVQVKIAVRLKWLYNLWELRIHVSNHEFNLTQCKAKSWFSQGCTTISTFDRTAMLTYTSTVHPYTLQYTLHIHYTAYTLQVASDQFLLISCHCHTNDFIINKNWKQHSLRWSLIFMSLRTKDTSRSPMLINRADRYPCDMRISANVRCFLFRNLRSVFTIFPTLHWKVRSMSEWPTRTPVCSEIVYRSNLFHFILSENEYRKTKYRCS